MKKNKTLSEIWGQVPADYYEVGVKNNLFQWIWHNWKWYSITKLLKKLNPKPKTILDVGCSSGHITAKIANFFPRSEIIGIDSYQEVIKYGKKIHSNIIFKVGDAHELPFENNSFDLITCTETLEHLENPKKALLEMKRCLKDSGYLLIGQDTDNFSFKIIWNIWTNTYGKVWQNSHLHPLNSKLLGDLIEAIGFKIKIKRFSQLGLEVFYLALK